MTEYAIYIGAGTDFKPTHILPEAKYFIYVDKNEKNLSSDKYEELILEKAKRHEFNFHSKKNNLLILKRKDVFVLYFYNCEFPKCCIEEGYDKKFKKILEYIGKAKYLICIGYFPNKIILDYLPKKFWYVGYYDTCYCYGGTEKNVDNYFLDKKGRDNRLYGVIFTDNRRTLMFKNYGEFAKYFLREDGNDSMKSYYGSESDE